eukprot:1194939-Prorocentrum_minimum.AAC.2
MQRTCNLAVTKSTVQTCFHNNRELWLYAIYIVRSGTPCAVSTCRVKATNRSYTPEQVEITPTMLTEIIVVVSENTLQTTGDDAQVLLRICASHTRPGYDACAVANFHNACMVWTQTHPKVAKRRNILCTRFRLSQVHSRFAAYWAASAVALHARNTSANTPLRWLGGWSSVTNSKRIRSLFAILANLGDSLLVPLLTTGPLAAAPLTRDAVWTVDLDSGCRVDRRS